VHADVLDRVDDPAAPARRRNRPARDRERARLDGAQARGRDVRGDLRPRIAPRRDPRAGRGRGGGDARAREREDAGGRGLLSARARVGRRRAGALARGDRAMIAAVALGALVTALAGDPGAAAEADSYKVDWLAAPEKSVIEVGGLDFLPDGR